MRTSPVSHRNQRRCKGLLTFTLLFVLAGVESTPAQVANTVGPQGLAASTPTPLSGVTVETVEAGGEGQKAGMQQGDIILEWSRGSASGKITSPFDLADLELDQQAWGTVTISGLRGAEKREWRLGSDPWKVRTRPVLSGSFEGAYDEAIQLASAVKWPEAAERFRAIAEQAHGLSEHSLSSWVLLRLAELEAGAGRWKEADAAYQESIQAGAGPGIPRKLELLTLWARTFVQRNKWDQAEKLYLEAAGKRSPGSLRQAADFDDLGDVCRARGDLLKAQEYLARALQIKEQLAPGSVTVAATLSSLSYVAAQRAELNKAEEYGRHATAILQALAPGTARYATAINNLGIVSYLRGDLDKAEELFQQALTIRDRLIPNSRDLASSLNNLGLVSWERGDFSKAKSNHLRALEIRQKLDPEGLDVARSLDNLGIIAFRQSDLVGAEKYILQCLGIRQRLAPGSLDVASNFNTLGLVAWRRGDWARAEEFLFKSLAINQKMEPSGLDAAGNLENLGLVALSRGELAKADEYSRQALAIYQKNVPGSLNMALALGNLGEIAQQRGDLAQAANFFQQGLAIREKLAPGSVDAAWALNRMAAVTRAGGDLDTAEKYYRRALDVWEKLAPASINKAHTLAALASIMRERGQLEQATPFFQQALEALENQVVQLGGTEEVREEFRGRYAEYYQSYIDLLVRQNKDELALEALENSRAQTLRETLAFGRIDIQKGADPDLLQQARSLQSEINTKSDRRAKLIVEKRPDEQIKTVENEISRLLVRYRETQAEIRSKHPAYTALLQPKSLSTREIQNQLLDPQTVLLEYSLGEQRSYLFVVTNSSLVVHTLPKRSSIEALARRLYELLRARNRIVQGESEVQRQTRISKADGDYVQVAFELSQMILAPAQDQIKNKRLLICADGALHYIAFSTLAEPSVLRDQERSHPQPLLISHEIVSLASASALSVLRQQGAGRQPAPKAIAVLADPVFETKDDRVRTARANKRNHDEAAVQSTAAPGTPDSGNLSRSAADLGLSRDGHYYLPRLIFSGYEANAILAAIPKEQSLKALDFNASRATAMSPDMDKYRIIHFATHGLLNSEHPELSGLVFSLVDKNGKSQNGFLQLQDVYNMNLSADLVVLSACETGLGKEINGEGLIGLTRGFMYAGASRVVASLWKVSDVATAKLMGYFYSAMEKDGLTPAAALRAAQIQTLKQKRWSSPYYWAAFQIHGEWK
jgi:CHAT domain-containing protein